MNRAQPVVMAIYYSNSMISNLVHSDDFFSPTFSSQKKTESLNYIHQKCVPFYKKFDIQTGKSLSVVIKTTNQNVFFFQFFSVFIMTLCSVFDRSVSLFSCNLMRVYTARKQIYLS